MNFEEVKNSLNEWLWDSELHAYFWILGVDDVTKIIEAKGYSGQRTKIFFAANRFFKNMKPV